MAAKCRHILDQNKHNDTASLLQHSLRCLHDGDCVIHPVLHITSTQALEIFTEVKQFLNT